MSRILRHLPELEGEEQLHVARLLNGLSDDEVSEFAAVYRARRKDPSAVLVTSLIGLVAIAGVQRFYLGQIGMGLLYFFTGGLCLVGTILDAVNHKRLASDFNVRQADEVVSLVRGALPEAERLRRLT